MAYRQGPRHAGLDAANVNITHGQLHTGPPGESGEDNVLPESERTPITITAADDDTADGNMLFEVNGATDPITHMSWWDTASGGAVQATSELTEPRTFEGPGSLAVTLTTTVTSGTG